ncbi:MAG TPA: hypothetical protein VEC76_04100 [Streptosporangiaceae bacterium]|nr:hypothetical protein [Streptosporangiaceae bacterium]
MTSGAAYPGNDPRQLLSGTRELARQVRRTQRATWFPLLVLAAVIFAAIPFRYTHYRLGTCVATGLARVCTAYPPALLVYWPIALVLAYVVIAAFYIRRSQARGVGTRVRPYVVAGIILALAMTGLLVWTLYHPLAFTLAGPGPFSALRSYPFAIGLALVVLAWAERNGALLALALGYLAVVLVTATVAPAGGHAGLGFPVQLVIPGSVLLLGGIGFLLAQRPWRRAA